MDQKITFTRKLNINGPFESNLFLRKLWSAFEELEISKGEKGNGWQYMPFELNENEIYVGSCNAAGEVIVKLGKSGGLDSISFKSSIPNKDEINACVDKALNKTNEPIKYCCIYYCESFDKTQVVNSSFKNVSIFSQKDRDIKVCINVMAFGMKDAHHILLNMFPYVSALLFVYFKHGIVINKIGISPNHFDGTCFKDGEPKQNEWYDGDEISRDKDGKYLVQTQLLKALNVLESLVWDRKNDIYPILNSARNIHLADDELDVLFKKKIKRDTDYSLLDGYVNGMIMSALEGLATRNSEPKKCPECGQPIYSISKAVRDYVSINFNDSLADTAMYLYNKRSKLFHRNRITMYEYTGTSWPLLMTFKEDRNDEVIKLGTRKIKQRFISYVNFGTYINFIDYLIFLIRKELDDFFKVSSAD